MVTEKQLDFNFSPTPNTRSAKFHWLSGLYKIPCPQRGLNFKGITSRNNTQADRCLSNNTCGFRAKKQFWPSRKGNTCELHGPAASIYYTLLFPFPTDTSDSEEMNTHSFSPTWLQRAAVYHKRSRGFQC